jgi:5-formyltetrahydrofolate cyclo-ligase
LTRARRNLDPDARAAATRRILAQALRLPQIRPGSRIAVYQAFGSELDPAHLAREALRRGARIYVPEVTSMSRRRMRFVPLSAARPAGTRPASRESLRSAVGLRWINLVFCPVVGIDALGYRLGMGAGFFDRALAFRRQRSMWRGPALIALAFDLQRVDSVLPDPWDARLDGVITESGFHSFLQRRP